MSGSAKRKKLGAPNPQQAVLSTATIDAVPHARVVAIREIVDENLVFFTQKGTRKVKELLANPQASLTFWFELTQREVVIEGVVEALSEMENNNYWSNYPYEARLRFSTYAPTSTQVINSKQDLEVVKAKLAEEYRDQEIPLSPFYCGFRFKPQRFMFYAYRLDELSDVSEFSWQEDRWLKRLLSP